VWKAAHHAVQAALTAPERLRADLAHLARKHRSAAARSPPPVRKRGNPTRRARPSAP
jgi:hypothetical protein